MRQTPNSFISDPDRYRFRIVALPANLTLPPHSREAEEIVITRGEAGDSIKSKGKH